MRTNDKTSETPPAVKRSVGRPATGKKQVIKAAMSKSVADQARKMAFDAGESLSQFISRAVKAAILQDRKRMPN